MIGKQGFVPDLEQQLLGAILSGGDHRQVFAMLADDQFVEPVHQEIFAAARTALTRFSSTTIPVVLKLMRDDVVNTFKTETGSEIAAYMARCTSGTLFGAGTSIAAARNVLSQWARLSIADEATLAAQAAVSPESDPVLLLREMGSRLDDIGSSLRRGARGQSRVHIGEAAGNAIAAAKVAREAKGVTGITTGLADLDRLTGGLQRRDLVLLGARPSMGKTTLGTSIGLSAARKGHGVGVFSLEMDQAKLTTRMLSDLAYRRGSAIAYEEVINGTVTVERLDELEALVPDFQRMPIWIDDASGLTISDIRSRTEKMVAEADQAGFSMDLLVIDHLLKVRPSQRYSGNRVLELGEITEGIKELAREFNLAALLLTQLNRALEQRDDKRPTLADLRDSGAIEQDADTVAFLYRESYYLSREKPTNATRAMERDADLAACVNRAEVEIAKQRNGRTATVELFTDIGCSYFGNAARTGYGEATRG